MYSYEASYDYTQITAASDWPRLLNQARAGRSRRALGFLELLLSANFCMRVCVSAPEAINN